MRVAWEIYGIGALLAAAAVPAQTADAQTLSLGVTGGTLGIGPEYAVRLSPRFGLRGNATFLKVSPSFDSDDIEYDGSLRLRSTGLMADVFPFGGSFRLSTGARYNGNRGRVEATPGEDTQLGDGTYTAAEIGRLTGRATVKKFAPALTLGYGGSMRSGLFFGTEAGVLFQGKVRIRDFRATGTAAGRADFREQLENERRALQDDVDDYRVYPILQLTVGYRF